MYERHLKHLVYVEKGLVAVYQFIIIIIDPINLIYCSIYKNCIFAWWLANPTEA